MSKVINLLSAAVLALTLSEIATAADSDQKNSKQPGAQQPDDPAAGGATVTQHEQEYLAALKKCEEMTGTDKSTCIEAAKKKSGQM